MMKHAGTGALDHLEPVLAKLRKLEGLRERNRGVFYRGSSAFLHFHEDPAGFFADMKVDGDFVRFRVNTQLEITALLARAALALKG
jgi:hypothetical protein